jgi:hypothetical protein
LVENPAVSEAQRRYLNAEFGHDWVKEHEFDNKGKLPETVDEESTRNAMNLNQKRTWWQRLGESLGVLHPTNNAYPKSKQGRHLNTGRFHENATTVAGKSFADLARDGDDGAAAQLVGVAKGPSTRKTAKVKRVPGIDIDGDGDGPVDDDNEHGQDEVASMTVPNATVQPGGKYVDKGVMNQGECEECGGELDEDGECEDCGWTENANPEGINQYTGGGGHSKEYVSKAKKMGLDAKKDIDPNISKHAISDPKLSSSPMTHAIASDYLKKSEGDYEAAVKSARDTAEKMKDSPHSHHHKNAADILESVGRSADDWEAGQTTTLKDVRGTNNSSTCNEDEDDLDMDEDGEIIENAFGRPAFGKQPLPQQPPMLPQQPPMPVQQPSPQQPPSPVQVQPQQKQQGPQQKAKAATTPQPKPAFNEDAHASSSEAAAASMEHGAARSHAVAAYDHSKNGKGKRAAGRHLKAAESHEEAATESRSNGDQEGATAHDNAASLHRKAASMHQSVVNAGMEGFDALVEAVGPEAAGAIKYKEEGGYSGDASKSADSKSKVADDKGTKGANKAAASEHKKAAKMFAKEAATYKAKGDKVAAKASQKKSNEHTRKAEKHSKQVSNINKEASMLRELIANCTCQRTKEALMKTLNAKVPGSNADETGDGDFDEALQAGNEEDTNTMDVESKVAEELDYEDTKEEADEETSKTGGKGATDQTRGRVGNRRMNEYELDQFSRIAFGIPIRNMREVVSNAAAVDLQARKQVINQLLAHVPRNNRKQAFDALELNRKSLKQLKQMLVLRPVNNSEYDAPLMNEANYIGRGVGFVPTANDQQTPVVNNDVECMVPPVVNFKQWAEEDKQLKRA